MNDLVLISNSNQRYTTGTICCCHCINNAPVKQFWQWVQKDLQEHVNPGTHLEPNLPAVGIKIPLDTFMAHCVDKTFELLTLESNCFMRICEGDHCLGNEDNYWNVFI